MISLKEQDLSDEGQILHIKYNCGQGEMSICLPKYLESMSLTQIKKVIHLIEKSETPDELEKLESCMIAELQGLESRMKEAANKTVCHRTHGKEMSVELQKLIDRRCLYKSRSQPYKDLTQQIKDMRSCISQNRTKVGYWQCEFNKLAKYRDKLTKLLKGELHHVSEHSNESINRGGTSLLRSSV
jgi:hypothetical protein